MVTSFNTDSVNQAGVFLTRQLEQRLPKVYEKRYPALKFGNGTLLPATPELEAGAESVVEEIMDLVGSTDESVADQIFDIPLADANVSETKFGVVCKPIAVRYSVRELVAAAKGGRNIRGMRELAARRAIEESINRLSAFGDSKRGIPGMLTDSNVPVVSSLTDSLYDPAVTDADGLIDYLTSQVTKIVADSKLTEEPNTMAVPVKLHERLTNTRIPNSPLTVRQFILENNPYITDIKPVNELSYDQLEKYGATASGTNKDMILIYPNNAEVVQRLFTPMTIMEPQLHGLNYVVIFMVNTTGAIWHYPGSALKILVPKP